MPLLIVNRLKGERDKQREREREAHLNLSFITFSTVSHNSIKIKLAT